MWSLVRLMSITWSKDLNYSISVISNPEFSGILGNTCQLSTDVLPRNCPCAIKVITELIMDNYLRMFERKSPLYLREDELLDVSLIEEERIDLLWDVFSVPHRPSLIIRDFRRQLPCLFWQERGLNMMRMLKDSRRRKYSQRNSCRAFSL